MVGSGALGSSSVAVSSLGRTVVVSVSSGSSGVVGGRAGIGSAVMTWVFSSLLERVWSMDLAAEDD